MEIVLSFVSFCLHFLDIQTQHFDCCGVSFAHWRVFIKTSCLQLFQELLIRKNYFSWAVSTPGLIDVVLRSDVLNLVGLPQLSFIVILCVLVYHFRHFAFRPSFPKVVNHICLVDVTLSLLDSFMLDYRQSFWKSLILCSNVLAILSAALAKYYCSSSYDADPFQHKRDFALVPTSK